MDIYDNEGLIHYLSTGHHLPGRSKSNCKNVERLSKSFVFENNTFYVVKQDKRLEVPRKELRQKIVETAHLLGHFQVETTLKRLQEKYYWPKMYELVKQIIASCLICQKFERSRIYDHPARALPVTGLFDRVGMDLVFGFPITIDGFKGLLILTDYLSKYPFTFLIKSKTAYEIATKFFEFISYFGPPKELLSDQGTEFLNKLVDHVSTISGVERKVTAAYHPRTNGLTENFNKTLVNSLRKHVVDNPIEWHQWIPYIMLAYRTRIQSTTGYSPIELVTGKIANHFQSWNCEEDRFETDLINRATELKILVEVKRPK